MPTTKRQRMLWIEEGAGVFWMEPVRDAKIFTTPRWRVWWWRMIGFWKKISAVLW